MANRSRRAITRWIVTRATYSDQLLPDANGDLTIVRSDGTTLYLPKSVATPWDINVGFALQVFGRPLNPRWRANDDVITRLKLEAQLRALDREHARGEALASASSSDERKAIQEKYESDEEAANKELDFHLMELKTIMERELTIMNRHYLTVSASMLLSGAVENSVGVESLVVQTVNRSGQHVVLSPRVGVEASVFPQFLKVRGGSYIEPTRFDSGDLRVHATAGLDIKLAVWNAFGLWPDDYMWRLGLGGDIARDYITWGLTIAGWYPRHSDPAEVPDYAAPLKPSADP